MPVAPNRSNPARQAIIIAIAGILGAVAIFFLLTRAVNFGSGSDSAVNIELGDSVFRPGNVDRLSDDIAKAGPLLLSDVSGGDRDVYLQHVGADPMEGWTAFGARPPAAPRDCFASWQPESRTFVDVCDGTTYPEDGSGLPVFEVTVSPSGELTVKINS